MNGYPDPGSVVGNYRLEQLLGEGGMGAVFKAADHVRGRYVALKFPAPELRVRQAMLGRFVQEATAAARIANEHVRAVYGIEALPDGTPYIVMEFLEGGSLEAVIASQAPLEVPRAVHMALQMLRALQVAHAAGAVHRDMKPSNCFLVPTPADREFLKLIDLGITKLTHDEAHAITRTAVTLGTPAYMSPEQARSAKAADARSDLYSVGVILYELLTGKLPYEAQSGTDLIVKICTVPPIPLRQLRPELPIGLVSAVELALVKAAEGRIQTAGRFVELLRPFADARSAAVLARIDAFVAPAARPGGTTAPMNDLAHAPTAGAEAAYDPTLLAQPAPIPAMAAATAGKTQLGEPSPYAVYSPGVPAAPTTAPVVPVIPPPPGIPQLAGPRPSGPGASRTPLLAVLGVMAAGLIGGGIWLALPPRSAPSTAPAAPHEEAERSHPSASEESDDDKSRQRGGGEEDELGLVRLPPPGEALPQPDVGTPIVARPPTTSPSTRSTGSGAPSSSTRPTASGSAVPSTSTRPRPATPPSTPPAPPATTPPPPATTPVPTASTPPFFPPFMIPPRQSPIPAATPSGGTPSSPPPAQRRRPGMG